MSFSIEYESVSAWLRTSADSRRFLSSAACSSASRTMRSMSSFGRLEPPVIVIDCSLPVPLSFADTCTMPFASMSNVTSTCGMPRGAGAMPVSSKVPSGLLSRVNSRSPWNTWIATDGWLSSAVVNVSLRLVGMAVLRSMSFVMMPPLVSIPRLRGVTSISSTSLRSPLRTPACRAAPTATTSSGLTPLLGSLPPVSCLTSSVTCGMRVEPPTRTTWSMSATLMPASATTSLNGFFVRSSRSFVRSSNFARVIVSDSDTGPESVSERYGRLIEVLVEDESSFFACSAASLRRCSAILSPETSTPVVSLNCLIR